MQGSVYIFDASSGIELKIINDPNTTADQFGNAVAISNKYAIIGARSIKNFW